MRRNGATPGSGVFWALVISVFLCTPATILSGETLSRVRIETPDAPSVSQQLIDAGFDVLEGSVTQETLEVVVSDAELGRLGGMGFQPSVVEIGRPFHEIQEERAAVADITPPGYLDLAGVLAAMNGAATAHPEICQMIDLTETYNVPPTYEGRHMFAVKISDNVANDEDEPTFLLVSAHHSREIVTPVIALHAIEQLTDLYGSDPTTTDLVNEYEIWIAPIWNPDGYVYVFNVDNTWRKNRHYFGPNPDDIGVELNRNYPFGWSSACAGSTSPSDGGYKGTGPASESETQTMVALSNDRRFTKVLDFHSSGTEVLRGYHCLEHPFHAFLVEQAAELADAFGFNGRTRPPSAEGEHYEWQFAMMGAQANLVEITTPHQPPYADAQQEAIDLFPGILFSLQRPVPLSGHVTDAASGEPVVATLRYLEIDFENGETNASGARFGRYQAFLPPGEVTVEFSAPGYITQHHVVNIDPQVSQRLDVQLEVAALNLELITGPSGLIEIGQAPEVVVEITPAAENLVSGSATLYHRYDGGPFATTPLVPAGGDLHSATLPLIETCGDTYEYYFTALGDGGTLAKLPANAPTSVYEFEVGESQITVAFDDTWRFFKGVQEPSPADLTAWTEPGFDDSSWEAGAGSFGYGTDCAPYGTLLDDMPGGYRSFYIRSLFNVADPGIVLGLTLTADHDDGFVAYINGVEVARDNVLGAPPLFDTLASSDHECSGSPLAANPPRDYPIHESLDLAALLLPGDNVLAIQGHNLSDTSSDFTLEMTLSSVICGCNDDADCEDADLCNGVETCVEDVCVPGTPIACDPLICDPADGSCVACLADGDCDDGDACNGAETCDAGTCVPGTALDCDDDIACTDDTCDPVSGCSNIDNCSGAEVCNPSTGLCEEPVAAPLPIVEGDEWRYFKGIQEPSPGDSTAWTAAGFDDASWLLGSSGFGYGSDCSNGTALGDMQDSYGSLYLRRLFRVDYPALVEELTLTMDYDDSFVAYVNGVEVARNNVLGSPPAFDTLAQVDHECSGSPGAANPPESIDLHLGFDPTTLLQSGVNVLAIQGHNLTLGSSDFTLLPTLSAVEADPCIDAAECADGDLCTVDECVAGVCLNPPVSCPPGAGCNPADGQCELQTTLSFQEGVGGYAGTLDTFIQEEPSTSDNDNGASEALNWDTDDPLGSGYAVMTLIRFEDVFGDGAGQVPEGASIRWAGLSYTVGGDSNAPGDDGELHELLVPWSESVAWNSLGGSPGASAGTDYAIDVTAIMPGSPVGTHEVDVTASLQAWSGDPAANLGWIVVPADTNGVDVRSSEYPSDPSVRPKLTVTFVSEPECDTHDDCADSDLCNGTETCQAGLCIAGTPLDTDDGVACTDDACDPATGDITHAENDGLCGDGDACTTDSCDGQLDCVYQPVLCDDGVFCNGIESCQEGECVDGPAPDCEDGDSCTVDTCDVSLDTCTHVAPPVPAEVRDLVLHKPLPASTTAVLAWSSEPLATSYNVYRDTRADLGGLACFLGAVPDVSVEDDGLLPGNGEALFYLTTAVNCSGESSLGDDRPNADPCP